jgi:type IV pilus assembly protein PilZ
MNELTNLIFKVKDVQELSKAYMPFVLSGGIFVETEQQFNLGDKVTLSVELPDQEEAVLLSARVVWISFKNERSKMDRVGVGVSFMGEHASELVKRIEKGIQYSSNP